MSKSDSAFLADMLKYARKAHSKAAALTREQFDADEMLQFGLAYLIMIVGEAASRLRSETREQLPTLPWSDIIGMRHRLVHGYGIVSFEVVWTVATERLPSLIAALEKFTPPEPPSA
jgi:uncharacterized protein with HEPN domain